KQWQRAATELPASIIKRLPLRFTYNNNYFNDRYQGIPTAGYTALFERLLDGIDVRLGVDSLPDGAERSALAQRVVFTERIDALHGYVDGELDYRTLRFETETLETDNYQGNAVVNYTDREVPYTRIVEHKHFTGVRTESTIITREYPDTWARDRIPYYPIAN